MAGKAMDAWWAEQDKDAAYEANRYETQYPRAVKALERAQALFNADPTYQNGQALELAKAALSGLDKVEIGPFFSRLIARMIDQDRRIADLEKRLEVNDGR